ncbi:hypothetical protein [uncultured Salinicola sp.]|uniref:hypothetical protein n=1 Tax=uncultured Salinicola sp. TaxID=1193542 RepID=UPI00261701E6|nr:hypothetical protein [uncultured Salinicola sp.]|tara:strand:+ start:1822 stop:2709 length:888 start_codon:yes stop_codon:yes gene_type:complete
MKNLFLHAGAHKTGTTSMQRLFNKNFKLNDYPNFKYVGHRGVKSRVKPLLRNGGDGLEAKGKLFFEEIFRGNDTVLMSCEDIFGMYDEIREGTPYALMPEYTANLIKILPPDVNLYLLHCPRDYSAWMESAYAQGLKNGKSYSFKEFYEEIDSSSFSWLELYRKTLKNLRDNDFLMIWPYEFYKEKQYDLLDKVFSYIGIELIDKELPKAENLTYSHVAEELAIVGNKILSKEEKKVLRNFLSKTFSVSYEFPKSVHLDKIHRSFWSSRYAEELVRLEELAEIDSRVVFLNSSSL